MSTPRLATGSRARIANIADAVFSIGGSNRGRSGRLVLALVLGLGAHAAALMIAWLSNSPRAPSHSAKAPDIEITLDQPPSPAPPPEREPPPRTTLQPTAAAAAPSRTSAPKAAQPTSARAQAGQVITALPEPGAPLDLTGDSFVSGSASAYAGGATTAAGTSRAAVNLVAAARAPVTPSASLSRQVMLDQDEWQCPWPREAELAEIDQETVTLRVHVDVDGRASHVRVLVDPGTGFGAAARACASATRFSPALDRIGHPTAADSPPIRVRFTR